MIFALARNALQRCGLFSRHHVRFLAHSRHGLVHRKCLLAWPLPPNFSPEPATALGFSRHFLPWHNVRCPLLRSLLEAKRTCPFALQMSAFDPKRTLVPLQEPQLAGYSAPWGFA